MVTIFTGVPSLLRRRRRLVRGARSERPATRRAAILRGPFVLEGDLHPGAVREHLAVLEMHVELRDLGDTEVAERLRRPLDGRLRGFLPGLLARADQLDD